MKKKCLMFWISGLCAGFAIMFFVMGYYLEAQAQTQVTAHVEQSDLRTCLEQNCSQYDF